MTIRRIPRTAGPTAPAFKHGRRSRQAVEERRAAARLLQEVVGLVEEAGRALPETAEQAAERRVRLSSNRWGVRPY